MPSKYGGTPVDSDDFSGTVPPSKYGGTPVNDPVAQAGAQMRSSALSKAGAAMDDSQKTSLNMPSDPGFGLPQQFNGGKLTPQPVGFHEPTGPIENGVEDALVKGSRIAVPGQRMSGLHNIIKGAGEIGSVALPASGVAAPIATAAALAGSSLGGFAGSQGARAFGASPDAQDLAGDAGAIVGGGVFPKLAGKLIAAPASPIAEKALGIRGADREFGATPGKAILEDTSGVRPSSIEQSARQTSKSLTAKKEDLLRNSSRDVDLSSVNQIHSDAAKKAAAANGSEIVNRLRPMQDFMTNPTAGFAGNVKASTVTVPSKVLGPNGQPIMMPAPGPSTIDPVQPPLQALDMQRMYSKQFLDWNKNKGEGVPKAVEGTGRQAYHQFGNEIEKAAPGVPALNQRIQSLQPVINRAHAKDLADGALENAMGRIARPTGALVAPVAMGAKYGPAGFVTGLGLPEMVSSPTPQMVAARTLDGVGTGMQSPSLTPTLKAPVIGAAIAKKRDKKEE